MDDRGIDTAARTLATLGTRRAALRLLAAGAFGALLTLLGVEHAAACRKNGKECARGGQCCSGICKRGACRRAPGQGTCTIELDACRSGSTVCNGASACHCHVTARGASFCGLSPQRVCAGCVDDRDCEFVTGPGSVCVRQGSTVCACAGGFTRLCVPPCRF